MQYWEDEADEVRVDEGTLLPLWKFGTTLAGTKQVGEAQFISSRFTASFESSKERQRFEKS